MKYIIYLLVAISVLSCATQSKYIPKPIFASGEYQQVNSGMIYPERIGGFTREKILQFNKNATHIGVGYNNQKSNIALTLFSYPAPTVFSLGSSAEVVQAIKNDLFNKAYERSKQDILQHQDSILEREGQRVLSQDSAYIYGEHSSFTYTGQFAGKVQKLSSHLYMFQVGHMLYKYRVTYPITSSAQDEVDQFIDALVLRDGT
ncbi:MAG: hypothetical protein GY820_07635 [Gammaproteobacteria bacterium]|nr:hypothetical protein [Gammaproteobacteria bacterium]